MAELLAISWLQSDTMIKEMIKMKMNTIFIRKAVNYEELFNDTKEMIRKFGGKIEKVEIEKIIEMTKEEFDGFKSDLLKDQEFIKDNKDFSIFLVKEQGTKDERGIIVDTQGYNYPRYTGLSIIEEEFYKCNRCGNYFIGEPAVSRKDNKSEVCSKCGIEEALENFKHKDIIEYCLSLQEKADKFGVEITVKTPDGYERTVRPINKVRAKG